MTEDRTIFHIPDVNLPAFEAACGKLSRKAVKIGCAEIKPFIFGYALRKLADGLEHRVYEVLFTAEAPKLAGWTFVARIDHANETGNIIRHLPNSPGELPAIYRTARPHCDHCGLTRRRRDTFVLRCDRDATYKQVGSSCLQDFFGHDPVQLARLAELLGYAYEAAQGAEEFNAANSLRDPRWIDVTLYCQLAAAAIRQFGWVSGQAAYADRAKIATRSRATGWYHDFVWRGRRSAGIAAVLTEADRTIAAEALDWATGLRDQPTLSEYENNILVVAEAAMMEPRSAGLAASIVGVYLLQRDRIAERAAQAAFRKRQATIADSVYMGKIREKLIDLPVTLIGQFTKPGSYGLVYMYRMLSDDGNVLTWFAAQSAGSLPDGSRLRLSGTIKAHEIFKDVKQTIVTRCKLVKLA